MVIFTKDFLIFAYGQYSCYSKSVIETEETLLTFSLVSESKSFGGKKMNKFVFKCTKRLNMIPLKIILCFLNDIMHPNRKKKYQIQ